MKKKRSPAQLRNDRRLRSGKTKKKKSYKKVSANAPTSYKKSKKSDGVGKWLPMNSEDHIISFSAGAITAPINDLLKPYQEKYLGWAGQYSDEAGLMGAGVLGNKFGHKLKPIFGSKGSQMIKKVGKKVYDVGVISLGQQTGSGIAQAIVDKIKSFTGQQQNNNASNGVIIG